MSAAALVLILLAGAWCVGGSRDGSRATVSPTVVCLTRGRSYSSHRRQLSAAFFKTIGNLNRNSSFSFRPAYTLSYRIVELSEFSPPEVRPSLVLFESFRLLTYLFASFCWFISWQIAIFTANFVQMNVTRCFSLPNIFD